ncbi:unnamed protein product [Taenia asiatica]|uniref:Integrase catalytic domain-containing protein n=1 Tax=Taenia asiatica TaxID=60517 RepID=A0A0R3WE56_TAEAS|nr:unnamed protein product [Taenia asiatica]
MEEILWYQKDAMSFKLLVLSELQELHEQLGHIEEEKVVELWSKRYWWPPLTPDLLDFCQICISCSSFKKPHATVIAPLQPMPKEFPYERVGTGIVGLLPLVKKGNRYVLVMADYFMKAAEVEPMKSQDSETVTLPFFDRWLCQHPVPKSGHSNQGPNFKSRLFPDIQNRKDAYDASAPAGQRTSRKN